MVSDPDLLQDLFIIYSDYNSFSIFAIIALISSQTTSPRLSFSPDAFPFFLITPRISRCDYINPMKSPDTLSRG